MAVIKGTVTGVKELYDGLLRTNARLRNNLQRTMNRVVIAMQSVARHAAPVDTGLLRSSIDVTSDWEGDELIGSVGSVVEYAAHMEYGTKAHWPPIAALEGWARRHHTSAFLVARAIAQHGIEGVFYMRQAYEKHVKESVKMFRDAIRDSL